MGKNWITHGVGKHLFPGMGCLDSYRLIFRRSQTVFVKPLEAFTSIPIDKTALRSICSRIRDIESKQLYNKDMGEYKFIKTVRLQVGNGFFSVKQIVTKKPRQSITHELWGDVSDIIDNRLCAMKSSRHWPIHQIYAPRNDGNPTIEIFNEVEESIMTNAKTSIKPRPWT